MFHIILIILFLIYQLFVHKNSTFKSKLDSLTFVQKNAEEIGNTIKRLEE